VLLPAGPGFTMGSDLECEPLSLDGQAPLDCQAAEGWYGEVGGEPNFQQLGGIFELDASSDGLLGGLLPSLVHIRAIDPAAGRFKWTSDAIVDEALSERPGRELVVSRLIEVLLLEALRYQGERMEAPGWSGLLAGLADPALSRALKRLHGDVAYPWSVKALAREAGLSRSVFSQRFTERVGVAPMQYVIEWRMTLAKTMLRQGSPALEAVAAAIGYRSASAFSTAFRRKVGCSPRRFARSAA
jgi:AraC-like DNA-binding protein